VNLECFWKPRSVVVVGASPKGGLGYNVLRNLKSSGVKIFAVNPTHQEIGGVIAYPNLKDLPEIPDCGVFATRAESIPGLLKEAGEKGIKGAVIYASGFGETASGEKLEKELQQVARQYDMAVCGPNCLGLANFTDGISLLSGQMATDIILKTNKLPGHRKVSIISQSGGLMVSVGFHATSRGLKIHRAVSSGNEAVTDICDYLDDFIDDDGCNAILVIAESIRRPEKFISVAERAMFAKKPIIWLPLGRTEAGAEVAATHTGAIARPARILEAVFDHFGIIVADSLTEFVEAGILCTCYPEPPSARPTPQIAILSITGGGAVHCTDWAERVGLKRAALNPETVSVLQEKGSSFAPARNPVDTGLPTMLDKDRGRPIIKALIDDKAVDILLVITPVWKSGDVNTEQVLKTLDEFCHMGKPIVVISTTTHSFGEYWHPFVNSSNIAFIEDIGTGFKILSSWARGGLACRESAARKDLITEKKYKIRGPSDRLWTEYEGEQLLKEAGIPIPMGEVAKSLEEVVHASERMGYPVMLKVIYPPVEHKARMGFVAGPLRNSKEVTGACKQMLEKPDLHSQQIQFLVHQYVPDIKAEIMVSITNRFEFGSFLILSVGGRFVLEEEAKVILLPCSEDRIRRSLLDILHKHLDMGVISGEDIDKIVFVIQKVIALGLSASNRLRTIEINPLAISGDGLYAVDAVVEPKPETKGAT
jgi:acyl-CoA synthetase (NDP forming)